MPGQSGPAGQPPRKGTFASPFLVISSFLTSPIPPITFYLKNGLFLFSEGAVVGLYNRIGASAGQGIQTIGDSLARVFARLGDLANAASWLRSEFNADADAPAPIPGRSNAEAGIEEQREADVYPMRHVEGKATSPE